MGQWTTGELDGRPAEFFEPSKRRFGLIYLHGAGRETLIDKTVFTQLFEEHQLACVRPEGGESWWSARPCAESGSGRVALQREPAVERPDYFNAERYVLDNVLPSVQGRWSLGPRSIGLFGISMGGQGALRMAFKRPETFPVVAAISPAIEYQQLYGQGSPLDEMYASREQCRQDTAPLHIHPSEYPRHIYFCCDPGDALWFRGCDRLHEKLTALGIAHECDLTTEAGGHTWDYYNHVASRVMRFLADGLDQESRRLL